MSAFWFVVACILLFAFLHERGKTAKVEAKRSQLQKEAAELWDSRAKTQQTLNDVSARLATVTQSLQQAIAEREHALARLGRIEGLGELEDAIEYAERLREFAERELEKARAEAQAIAGAAYELVEREDELRQNIKALENTIKGYGDEYLHPTSSLLDEMEELYGFADSAKSLTSARASVKRMIKERTAAQCEYVEPNRRETAIAFVLDAFNGKVDSALAGVKSDNFGKLEQKIKDAFHLVNLHGEAFRNARVTPAYLDAQIHVLRWAVAVQELKRREREEQRELREQMREEEKAEKEYERALRQAERDEEVARKAVEETRKALLQSTDAEKQKLEEKLNALTLKLVEAEARGQRAMSMAQQTRAGTVYVISNVGSFGEEVLKIGMTRRLEPEDRIKELGDASVPFPFDIHALIRTDDAPTLEKELHKAFVRAQVNKVNPRKEFFRVAVGEIRAEVERRGVEASWTMRAACAEWRETKALEEELAKEDERASRWVAKQVALEEATAL